MVEEKYILMSMDDSRTKKISEVMSNKTCKDILDLLTTGELTETEIAKQLNLALNTVEYNIKKLIQASLIEKSTHWWSVKGKKMPSYRVCNKYIIISPRPISKLKSFIPVVLICGFMGVLVRYFSLPSRVYTESVDKVVNLPMANAPNLASGSISAGSSNWLWFIGGCLFSLVVYLIFNYKQMKGGQNNG